MIKKIISALVCLSFIVQTTFSNIVLAQVLPAPSATLLPLNQTFSPALVRGITLYSENPLKFSFLVDPGDQNLSDQDFQKESSKLIRYFLAALTTPEEDMWVNLSPTEKDRIIPESFGTTEMGQELLGQDYMLKQLTALLMNPDEKLGKEFWDRVYKEVHQKYGSTDIPLDTLNKVWIIPDKAEVLVKNKTVVVVESHLKVMMEEEYLNSDTRYVVSGTKKKERSTYHVSLTTQIIKEIILPAIEHEVNTGRNFAPLRQIQNSAILAAWYKKNLKRSWLGESYVDQKKIDGIKSEEKDAALKVYNQYLDAFKKGAYDTIQEDYNPETQAVVTRKYVSGGARIIDSAVLSERTGSDSAALGEKLDHKVRSVDFVLQAFGKPGAVLNTPQSLKETERQKITDSAMSAAIDFKHPPEWIQFVIAYYQRMNDTARLDRFQKFIKVRNAQTGASAINPEDDLLSKAVQASNPAAELISLLNSDHFKAAQEFATWQKEVRGASLEDLKTYLSSAIVTSVAAFNKYGIFSLFESKNGTLTMQEIVDYLKTRPDKPQINEGNIQGVLRVFGSLQWLTRSKKVLRRSDDGKTVGRDIRFTLTDKGKEVLKLAGIYQKSTEFNSDPMKMADFLSGTSKDGDEKFEEIMELAMRDWDLPADLDPAFRRETIMQLNGRFLGSLELAMPMRVYGQGILGAFDADLEMDLDQVIENFPRIENVEPLVLGIDPQLTARSRAKQRLTTAFKFFEYEGLVKVEGDKVKLTAKGVASLGKRILANGVKDSYDPTYAAVETFLFGDLSKVVWRDKEGRELMVHRKLNVEGSGAAHEGYFKDADKIIVNMINEKMNTGVIPSLEKVRASGEKFVFYVADTGSGDGAWLKNIYRTIMDKTGLGRLVKEHGDLFGLMMMGVDYNLDAREATDKTLEDSDIPHLVIPGDINQPQKIKAYFETPRFKNLGIKIENGFHVRSMLDHNRPYTGVKDMEAAQKRKQNPLTTAVFSNNGEAIPNNELEQNLFEYLEGWRDLAPELLFIELGTVREEKAPGTLDIAYQLSHILSSQYIMEEDAFFAIAQEAGYKITGDVKKYPAEAGKTTVTLGLLRSKALQPNNNQDNGSKIVAADAGQLGDKAMIGEVDDVTEAPGGIDLNPLHTELKEQGGRIDFDHFYAPIFSSDQLNVNGFVPVILHIYPPVSLPFLLGIRKEQEPAETLVQASAI